MLHLGKPTYGVRSRTCQGEQDLAGALCEVVAALVEGRYHLFSHGAAASPNEPGPGLDEDSGGYRSVARRALEECR